MSVVIEDVQALADAFPEVGTTAEHLVRHKGFITENMDELQLWGWLMAHYWLASNLLSLANHAPETMTEVWQTAFQGSMEALRAGLELWYE